MQIGWAMAIVLGWCVVQDVNNLLLLGNGKWLGFKVSNFFIGCILILGAFNLHAFHKFNRKCEEDVFSKSM